MEKFRVAKDMLLQGGILRPEEIIEVRAASNHLLQRIHASEYIRKIESGTLGRKEQILLGLPATPHLYTRSATEVEATRLACHAALAEGVGVCLAGGTHHAFREHGEGYCVFNDVAIANRQCSRSQQPPASKPWWWTPTPIRATAPPRCSPTTRACSPTRSTSGGNYPLTKITGSLDIETVRYVEGGGVLCNSFSSSWPVRSRAFADLVIWVSGADNHRNDRSAKCSSHSRISSAATRSC